MLVWRLLLQVILSVQGRSFMLLLDVWNLRLREVSGRLRVRQGVLFVALLLLMGAIQAQDISGSAEALGKTLGAPGLMVQEIEAQMSTLQLDAVAGEAKDSASHLPQALIAFYAQRQYRPIWDKPGRLEQLIAAIESLAGDGLNPDDYQLEQLRSAVLLLSDKSTAAIPLRVADELRATNAYLRALYHLYNGKVDPAGLDPQWNFELQDMAPVADAARLGEMVETGQIASLFEQTRPQHLIYRSFVQGLKHYRQIAAQGGWPALPVGDTLKPCMVDPQVAILRERLKATGEYREDMLPVAADDVAPAQECVAPEAKVVSGDGSSVSSFEAELLDSVAEVAESASASSAPSPEVPVSSASSSSVVPVNPDDVFDKNLVEAVKAFQRAQYLEADGVVGPATRAALNVSVQSRIDQIRVNLDRARWLLHNIPPEMLLVDVAGFKITYFKASQPIWRSRVQVGMSYRTSPIFRSEVNYITLNPTWTIPPTILRKDVLPKLRKDLSYLRDNKVRVLDSNGMELDPATVDWYKPGNVTLRQDAGPHAALGKAVVRFPNAYSVYLHDTPHQKLFNKSQRAFSSGCIRVERMMELVELLLAETPGWDKAIIDKTLGAGKTRNVTLAKRIPILLAYWTVDAVSETEVAFKPDIYTRDAQVLAALNRVN